jgi:2-phospho-L-lactate guanylyltransferase
MQPADLSRLHALLPVRGLTDGKERLGMALDAEERETLVLGMLRHVLGVLADWPVAQRTHVISGDDAILALAVAGGVDVVRDDAQGGLNAALRRGRERAVADGATAILCLPADLPLLSRSSLDHLLDAADAAVAAGSGRPVVVVAPADARGGTNALLLSPADVIEPAFGVASLEAHVRAAAHADASFQLVVDPLLGFDLDTPEDLERVDAGRLVELLSLGSSGPAAIETG